MFRKNYRAVRHPRALPTMTPDLQMLETRRLLSTTLYVDGSYAGTTKNGAIATPFTDLQSALTLADANASANNPYLIEITGAQGGISYSPSGSTPFSIPANVTVEGGFAAGFTGGSSIVNQTKISGNDAANHLITLGGNGALENVLILNGKANGTYDGNDPNAFGAGVYISDGSPTISGCGFENNNAMRGGAIFNNGASPTITDCTFNNNGATDAGACIYNDEGVPQIQDCYFAESQSTGANGPGQGAGVYDISSIATLTDCTFDVLNAKSQGGGAFFFGGRATLTGCYFVNNTTTSNGGALGLSSTNCTLQSCAFLSNGVPDGGGAIYAYNQSALTCTNCMFLGNDAGGQGGVYFADQSSIASFNNCTMTDNHANDGGAIDLTDDHNTLNVNNSILWEDASADYQASDEINLTGSSNTSTVAHSDVQFYQQSSPIDEDIDADPMFAARPDPGPDGYWESIFGGLGDDVSPFTDPNGFYGWDPQANEYNAGQSVNVNFGGMGLQANSLAINTGLNSLIPDGVTTDFAGNPRISGSAVDMGAMEYSPGAPATLKITAQPQSAVSSSSANFSLSVEVDDASGNPVTTDASHLALSIASGPSGAKLGGTTTAALAGGAATINSAALATAGTYTLTVTDATDGLSVTTAPFTISPGAASQLAILSAPAAAVPAGQSAIFSLALEDAAGNVTFATPAVTATGDDGVPLTPAYASNGIAVFAISSITPGANTYTFSAGSLSVQHTLNVISDDASRHLIFSQQPANATTNQTIAPVAVELVDRYGNPITDAPDTITLSAAGTAGAQLNGGVSNALSNGTATFNSLSVTRPGVYTLSAADGSLTANSNAFVVMNSGIGLAFDSVPTTATAGSKFSVTLETDDQMGNLISLGKFPITFTAGGKRIGSATISNGHGSAKLSIAKPGSYTITAASHGFASASFSLNVTAKATRHSIAKTSSLPATYAFSNKTIAGSLSDGSLDPMPGPGLGLGLGDSTYPLLD